jgi:hypothetical protein
MIPEDEMRRIEAWARRHIPALCCVCGQVRTVRANYAGRGGWVGEPFKYPEHLARAKSIGRRGDLELHWRHLRTLKCSACEDWTWHALVFEAEDCFEREPWNAPPWTQA